MITSSFPSLLKSVTAMLVAVYPANIHMALNPGLYPEYGQALLWVRLPIQLVLSAAVYWYTRRDAEPRTAAA